MPYGCGSLRVSVPGRGQVVLTVRQRRLRPARSRGGPGKRAACATGCVLGYPVCHTARKAGTASAAAGACGADAAAEVTAAAGRGACQPPGPGGEVQPGDLLVGDRLQVLDQRPQRV